MTNLEEHEAEQAAITARYEQLCAAGKMLHDYYGYHLDDLLVEDASNVAHDMLVDEMGLAKYDEWRADLHEAQANTAGELKAALGQLLEQVYQMQGMFPDEDGAIARAVADAEAAYENHQG